MSIPNEADSQEKKLAVGLNPYRHTQLSWIARLRGNTLNTEFLNAIDAHIEAAKHDQELISQAAAVRAEIERDAIAKQEAIANLFAATPETPESVAAEAITDVVDSSGSSRPRTARRGKAGGDTQAG